MKQKFLLLNLTLLLGLFSWNAKADTGWYQDYIILNVNGAGVSAPTGFYWIGSDPYYGTSLVAGLGNVSSLILDGADMKYWGDGADRIGGSFFYEIKSADGVTTYTAATEVIWTHTALGGNDFQGVSSGLNVDLLAGIPSGTACKLTVWAKSWGTNGDSWLNNGGLNYEATFTTQNVLVSGSFSQDGRYSTLGEAITAIGTSQEAQNIEIKIGASTTEPSAITIGAGTWASLKIYPTSSSIVCSTTNITLSGAKNVTIDGRVNQTGTPAVGATTSLTLSSTSTTLPVLLFDSDAQSNTVKYCAIKIGALPNTTGGIAFGATAATTNGNGNNVIDHNLITSSGGTYPIYAIWATGSTTNPNKGNQITNNEFINFLAESGNSIGIIILGNATANINDNYTISGNSMYGANVKTTSGGSRFFMQIGNAGNGGSHTITGNYIGGSSAQCGGSRLTKNSTGVVSNFVGIQLTTSATGTSLVQNNTIQNINWTSYAGNQNFTAIQVAGSGDATISGNVIGNNTTSGYGATASIIHSGLGANASNFNGLIISTTGAVTCQNNQIGSIKTYNNAAAGTGAHNFNGISKSGAGTTTISNNTIGSLTAPYSINDSIQNSTLYAQNATGINFTGTGTATISNNTIANITNRTSTGNLNAINMNGSGSTGTVNGNLIHSNIITGATTAINRGILCNLGTFTVSNNIVKLGENNSYQLRGINDEGGTNQLYHNTVFLSGAPTTLALNSACLYSTRTTARNYKNNILVNARSNNGATGTHYAMNITTSGSIVPDYNDYFVSGTGGVLGRYVTTDITTLPIVTGQDAASVSVNPSFTNPGGTTPESFVPSSLLTGVDLSATVPTDYNAVSRTTTPTMGAHDYRIYSGSWNSAPTTDYNARIDDTFSGAGFSSRNLVINAGKQLEITSGTLAVANNLTILSDADNGTGTLTYSGLTVGGTTTVQQYLPHARNWYVSSPVSGAVAPAGYTYYQRDEAGASWTSQPFSAGNTFTHGKGYIALPGAAASTISFSGNLNSGEITIPLTWSGASSKGFNLIGNPYPSHLTWTEAFVEATSAPEGGVAPATLIEPSIYVRTNAGTTNNSGQWSFQTYNASTGLAVPNNSLLSGGIIPPMQAFWVRSKQAGNLILTSALTKSHQTSNPLKAPALKNTDRQLIRLEVSNGTKTDETLLFFDANAENTYDRYDTPKFAEASTEVQIYTTVGDEKLVMNGLKTMPLNQEIALGFVPGSASAFSIKANEISNLPSDVRVILIDNATNGMETDLTDGTATYQFSASESTTTDRFSLLFRAPDVSTNIGNVTGLNAQVFVNASNQITIIAPEKCTYAIYNAVGQLMENGVIATNTQTSSFKHAAGVYLVKVGNSNSTRVIIK